MLSLSRGTAVRLLTTGRTFSFSLLRLLGRLLLFAFGSSLVLLRLLFFAIFLCGMAFSRLTISFPIL